MPKRLYLSIFIALYVLSAAGVFAQQAEPCGCKDIAQIEYLIREAGAAVLEQQSELPSHKLNTKENYDESQTLLQAAINGFQKGSELKTGIPPGEQVAHTFFSGKDGCHTEWSNPVLVSTPSDPLIRSELRLTLSGTSRLACTRRT